jgi:hypothetical protein
MDALRAGRQMRKCIFDTIEQRHAHDFGNSRVGPRLYEELLSAVRDSGAREAAKEFEIRFFPLVNSDPSRDKVDIDLSQELTEHDGAAPMADRRRASWGLIYTVFVVAFAGALIVAVNAVKITSAEATRSVPKLAAETTETTPPPAQAVETETEVPMESTKSSELATELRTEAVPAAAAEQELPQGE